MGSWEGAVAVVVDVEAAVGEMSWDCGLSVSREGISRSWSSFSSSIGDRVGEGGFG